MLVIAAGDEAVHGNHVQNVHAVAAISARYGASEAARESWVLSSAFVQMEVCRAWTLIPPGMDTALEFVSPIECLLPASTMLEWRLL